MKSISGLISAEKFMPIFSFRKRKKARRRFRSLSRTRSILIHPQKNIMFNLRVDDLDTLLEILRAKRVHVFDEREDGEYGKFGWILDIEDNKTNSGSRLISRLII